MYHHLVLICLFFAYVSPETDSVGIEVLNKLYFKCFKKPHPLKCLKIKTLKMLDRASHAAVLDVTDTIKLVPADNNSASVTHDFKDDVLEKLNSTEIDNLLYSTTNDFLESRRVQIKVLPQLVEEARGKKRKGYGGGPFMIALGIKGFFVALAYKGIAVMSAAAILIGKMALLLSALLGLKKLVNNGHEKTTFEIVKHPVYSQSHTHSTSHHHGGDDDHFYRSIGSEEEMMMQDKVYKGHYPRHN